MNAKKLFLFDIDGPIYRGHMVVDFAIFLSAKNLFDPTALEKLLETVRRYKRHRLAYRHAITGALKCYAKGIRGQSARTIRAQARAYLHAHKQKVYPASVRKLRALQKTARVGLVSLSPVECVVALEESLGIPFDYTYGTVFGVRKGRFDGTRRAHNPVDAKIIEIEKALRLLGVASRDTVFFGDTVTDRHSAHRAGVRFCPLHPDRELKLYLNEMKKEKKKKKGR